MEHRVQVVSSFLAALVGFCLCAWILLRGARSTPTRLMALLVGSLAELQGFEFLWQRHGADVVPIEEKPAGLRGERKDFEKRRVAEALRDCKGNRTHAAEKLGLSRRMLQKKLKEFGIE